MGTHFTSDALLIVCARACPALPPHVDRADDVGIVFIAATNTLKQRLLERHSAGILSTCRHRVGTNRLEGANKIKVLKRNAYGFRDFEYFALKVKGLQPGKENSAWKELDGLKMVRHDLSIAATVYVPLPKTKASINDCQALQSAWRTPTT